MQLAYTICYVEDVAKTLNFYRDAFGLRIRMRHESGVYGEMETGATTLSFTATSLMDELGKNPGLPDAAHPTFEIAFTTDDVQAALDRALEFGATLVQEALEMPWGQTTAYVTDLNGFLVEFCTPMDGAED